MQNDAPGSIRTPDEIVAEIARLMDEAEALLVGPVADQREEEFIPLREHLGDLQRRLAAVGGVARRKMTETARVADDAIRSHPYETAAVALGLGVLLGAVWQSRRG